MRSTKAYTSRSKSFARDLDRPVYALDARNHGESPQNVAHNYTVMAEDVNQFIIDHKLRDAIVIGMQP